MNNRLIKDISDFIFIKDELKEADVIMIPGGSYPELPERAAELFCKGYSPIVVPSGGVSIKTGKFNGVKSKKDLYNKNCETEFDFYKDVLLISGVHPDSIIGENKSSHTGDNAKFSKQILDDNNIYPKTAILCCKNFHARRALMFYQFNFPETEFFLSPLPYNEDGVCITKENWFKSEIGINRVLGELQRIGGQFGHFLSHNLNQEILIPN